MMLIRRIICILAVVGTMLANSVDGTSAETANTSGTGKGDTPLSLEALTATRLRPLFSPTRHPPIMPVALPPPLPTVPLVTKPQPPSVILIGVIVSPSIRLAILKPDNGSKPLTLSENQSIDGWTVVKIEPDSVILGNQSERFSLKLRRAQADVNLERDLVLQASPLRGHQWRDPRTQR